MKQLKRGQFGFSLIETAVVLVIIAVLAALVMQVDVMIDRAKSRAVVRELRSVQYMIEAYRRRFNAIPGDDRYADIHVGGRVSHPYPGNGKITVGNWNSNFGIWAEGESPPVSTIYNEAQLFWQHLRLAGLAKGDPNETYMVNILGGEIGITSDPGWHVVRPVGVAGTFVICTNNIPGRIARLVDSEMDDGVATTGRVFASNWNRNYLTPPTTPYVNGQIFTVCWQI